MDESPALSRALFPAAVALGSAAAFALVARAVARRETASLDADVHEGTKVEAGHPARRAAEAASPIGKWWTYLPAAALAGAYVIASRFREEPVQDDDTPPVSSAIGALVIVGSAIAAVALSHACDDLLPQPPAPPGRPTRDHPVFPSGHALGTMAVGLTAAYVLSREKLAPPHLAFPIALVVPTASSIARLMEEKHWISDIIGGYLAALALSATAAAAYETGRR